VLTINPLQTDSVAQWLDQAARYPILPKAEIIALAKRRDALDKNDIAYDQKYLRIINKITQHNLLLIKKVVDIYVRKRQSLHAHSNEIPDLLQAGYAGLRRAAELYDGTRGYAFSTYAIPWIRQAVSRQGHVLQNVVYIPEGTWRAAVHYKQTGEIADFATGTKNPRVLQSAIASMDVGSLDQVVKTGQPNGGGTSRHSDPLCRIETISDENKLISNEPTSDYGKLLQEFMDKAGIHGKTAELISAYGRLGRIDSAARAVGIKKDDARRMKKAAVQRMRHLALKMDKDKRDMWAAYLTR
tara:strand:+ start:271 stop:1167 length:897 start_codon:yes stop_codon:yes gene_type:complete